MSALGKQIVRDPRVPPGLVHEYRFPIRTGVMTSIGPWREGASEYHALHVHPDTDDALVEELRSLEGYANAYVETRLRRDERDRWADDGGAS
jgi:hypothetical protein